MVDGVVLPSTVPVPYPTVPSKTAGHKQLATIFKQGFQMQDHNVKQLGGISMYAKCIGICMQGDIVRVQIPGYVLKKK